MRKSLLTSILLLSAIIALSQENNVGFHIRVPLQYESQKFHSSNSVGEQEVKANAINFGLDGLLTYQSRNIIIHGGAGIFRNRFNLKREYDHHALNPGRDSLPIATDANHYTYMIARVPIGVAVQVTTLNKVKISLGGEHFINFRFRRTYTGKIPFEGANTSYNGFDYFGNMVNVFLDFRKNRFSVQPYIRVFNWYKKDSYLKERDDESETRQFDATGVALKYYFYL